MLIKVKFLSTFNQDSRTFYADQVYMVPYGFLKYIPADMYEHCTAEKKRLADIRKCLVIKSNGLGNAINIIPLIVKINMLDPKIIIDVLCLPAWKGLFHGLPGVRAVYSDDEFKTLIKESKVYDAVFHGVPMGFEIETLGITSDCIVSADHGMMALAHEVEVNCAMLDSIVSTDGFIPDTRVHIGQSRFKIDRQTIGVCPGYAKGSYWDIKDFGKWQEIVNELGKAYPDHDIMVFGQAGEWNGTGAIDMTGKTNLEDLKYLLSKCDFVIGNDTGTMHLASACGVKAYTIFGPTSWVKNVPWRNGVIIKNDSDCSPCQHTTRWLKCDQKKKCFDMVPADIVESIKGKHRPKIVYGFGTYDRYEMICIALNDILTWDNQSSMILVIVDDASTDQRIQERIGQFEKAFNGKLVKITHRENMGRVGYNNVIKKIIKIAQDENADAVLFGADDIIVNSEIITRAIKSIRLFDSEVKCIHFWKDERSLNPHYQNQTLISIHGTDWESINGGDGFLTMFQTRIFDDIKIVTAPDQRGSGVWFCVNEHLKLNGLKQIRSGISMGEHIGNVHSAMNSKHRSENPISAMNIELWN